jgi:hypothetical protein
MGVSRAHARDTNRTLHAFRARLGVLKSRKCKCQVVESNIYPAMNNLGSALRGCLGGPNNERSMRQMWREIVNSYSVRKLGRIEDKLPALSGIAGLLAEVWRYARCRLVERLATI